MPVYVAGTPTAPAPVGRRPDGVFMIGERICEENESETPWIPAFPGMTSTAVCAVIPAKAVLAKAGSGNPYGLD